MKILRKLQSTIQGSDPTQLFPLLEASAQLVWTFGVLEPTNWLFCWVLGHDTEEAPMGLNICRWCKNAVE